MDIQEQPGAWDIRETKGQPIRSLGRQITPIGRVWHIQWPGGGLIWHHPIAVEVEQEGKTRRLPIYNVTRRVSLALLAGQIITILIVLWMQRKRF
jgi:Zn-dependent protease